MNRSAFLSVKSRMDGLYPAILPKTLFFSRDAFSTLYLKMLMFSISPSLLSGTLRFPCAVCAISCFCCIRHRQAIPFFSCPSCSFVSIALRFRSRGHTRCTEKEPSAKNSPEKCLCEQNLRAVSVIQTEKRNQSFFSLFSQQQRRIDHHEHRAEVMPKRTGNRRQRTESREQNCTQIYDK